MGRTGIAVLCCLFLTATLPQSAAAFSLGGFDIKVAPNPKGIGFDDIDCDRANSCVTVGDGPNRQIGSLKLGPEGWSTHLTEGDGNLTSLFGVSCLTSDDCLAVGSSAALTPCTTDCPKEEFKVAASRWDGAGWTALAMPSQPANWKQPFLFDVSCVQSNFCFAVGGVFGRKSMGTLIMRWDGSSWTVQKAPLGLGNKAGSIASLNSVSCVSRSLCFAAGVRDEWTMIQKWDGSKWSLERIERARGFLAQKIECPGPKACFVTGAIGRAGKGPGSALVNQWNGESWSLRRTPVLKNRVVSLSDVSCVSARACIAVGTAESRTIVSDRGRIRPVVESWNGKRWKVHLTKGPFLQNISCAAPRNCVVTRKRGGSYLRSTS